MRQTGTKLHSKLNWTLTEPSLGLTADVGDGLGSDDLVLEQSLGLTELQVRLPAAPHKGGLLQTAAHNT